MDRSLFLQNGFELALVMTEDDDVLHALDVDGDAQVAEHIVAAGVGDVQVV